MVDMLTLAEAAQRTGLHRSNLLRAIKSGRVSGTRDESGAWLIDESELVRVYGDLRSATLQPAQGTALLELKLEHAEQRICDLMRRAERAEHEADEWREQAKRIALPPPSAPHQPAHPMMPVGPLGRGSTFWDRFLSWRRSPVNVGRS
jgi:excisionase family DNA binding protein